MKSMFLAVTFAMVSCLFSIAVGCADTALASGPYTLSIPDSWRLEEFKKPGDILTLSAASDTIAGQPWHAMITIERKKRPRDSIEELRLLLVKSFKESEQAKAAVDTELSKSGQAGLNRTETNVPTILNAGSKHVLYFECLSEFHLKGEKLDMAVTSFWVYTPNNEAYYLRMAIPAVLINQTSEEASRIKRSIRIDGAPIEYSDNESNSK